MSNPTKAQQIATLEARARELKAANTADRAVANKLRAQGRVEEAKKMEAWWRKRRKTYIAMLQQIDRLSA